MMWFKQRYVAAILNGDKTETLRRLDARVPAAGSIVPASVGPIRPFAWLHIDAVDIIAAADLSEQRRAEVAALLGVAERYQRITFHVVCDEHHEHHTASASARGSGSPM